MNAGIPLLEDAEHQYACAQPNELPDIDLSDDDIVALAYAGANAGLSSYSSALQIEFLASRSPSKDEVDRLTDAGVHPVNDEATFIKAANVEFLRDGRFEFRADGVRAFVLAVRDFAGEVIDMLAWAPTNPKEMFRLEGRGFALGEHNFAEALLLRRAIKAHRHALDWLRSGGRGMVVLEPKWAWSRLPAGLRIEADDGRHRSDLERLLRPPRAAVEIETPGGRW